MPTVVSTVAERAREQTQSRVCRAPNFIDGQWVWPDGAEEIRSINPANTRETICVAADSPASQIDLAIAAARRAFETWRRVPPPTRAGLLLKAADILAQRKNEIGRLVAAEGGKPIAEALGDVQEAIDMAGYAAGEGRRLFGQTTPSELPDKLCLTFREPVGVCALITPWNFPVAIPAWKTLLALIAGNTVVLKPAKDTPMCGSEFVRALADSGLPAGVVNLVQGSGEMAGRMLTSRPGIALISFTGSTETGRLVAESAGRSGKRVRLECGGKNAQIILEDADLDLAIDGAVWGAFATAGQRCTATSRLIVHEAVYDEVLDRLVQRARSLRLGDPLNESTQMGPLINPQQLDRVLNYIQIGQQEGARLVTGGQQAHGAAEELDFGFFVEPTIFDQVSPAMRIFQEEIFGPVLSVVRTHDLASALELINDSRYGLSSSIYTRDVNRALAAARGIEAGIVYVNGPTIGAEVHLPFGGMKDSGNGHREAGIAGLDGFTEYKTVYVDYSGRLQRAQIDTDRK